MAKKMSERDLIVSEIKKLLVPFKSSVGLYVEIKESYINKIFDVIVTNGTQTRGVSLHLEKSPFQASTIKYVQKELGFSKAEKSKYGQSKVTFS